MSWKDTPVSRASRRPRIQWTHDVCACLSPCARPPSAACRPRTHTVPAHGDPQQHVLLARAHARANPRHRRPCAPARAAERRQHRAHRHEWHDDTARQKREHRTLASKAGRLRAASKGEPAQLSRPAGLKSDNTIFMIITVTACDRAAHFSHGVLPCLIARVLTTLTTCNNLTVDLQACNGSIL